MHENSAFHKFLFFVRFPFETKSPLGYIVAIILQATGICVISLICTFAILFPVAHCLFLITFTLDLDDEIRMLNDATKIESYRKEKLSANRRIEIYKELFKIIQFQCDLKQLSELLEHITAINH